MAFTWDDLWNGNVDTGGHWYGMTPSWNDSAKKNQEAWKPLTDFLFGTGISDVGNPDDYIFQDPEGIYAPGGLFETMQGLDMNSIYGMLGAIPTIGTAPTMDNAPTMGTLSAEDQARYSMSAADMLAQIQTPEYLAQQKKLQEQQAYYDNAVRSYDPNAYYTQFLGQANGLSDLVSGQNSNLQGTLNNIASRQARMGGEAALASMPGMRKSGAAMASFGDAYANPFATAQAQLQQNQLQGTMDLWQRALTENAAGQNARLAANTQMGGNASNGLNSLISGTQGTLGSMIGNQNTNYAALLQNLNDNYTAQLGNYNDNYTAQLSNYNTNNAALMSDYYTNAANMWGANQGALTTLASDSTYIYEPTYMNDPGHIWDILSLIPGLGGGGGNSQNIVSSGGGGGGGTTAQRMLIT